MSDFNGLDFQICRVQRFTNIGKYINRYSLDCSYSNIYKLHFM